MLKHVHASTECSFQHLWGHYFTRGSITHDSVVNAHQVRQVSGHSVEVMGGENDGNTVFMQVGEKVQNVVTRRDVNTASWFIE